MAQSLLGGATERKRINIEEATGISYTERDSLCLAFYTVRQWRIKLYNHCWAERHILWQTIGLNTKHMS